MHGPQHRRISDSFRILLTNKTLKFINAYQGWQQDQPDPAGIAQGGTYSFGSGR